ncbi:MAG TPA: hypothetical protein VI685_00050 [Candidatus Angelobacter sp.]
MISFSVFLKQVKLIDGLPKNGGALNSTIWLRDSVHRFSLGVCTILEKIVWLGLAHVIGAQPECALFQLQIPVGALHERDGELLD